MTISEMPASSTPTLLWTTKQLFATYTALLPLPCGVLILAFVYFISVRYNTPLRKIPGPLLGSFTRLWKVSKILYDRQDVVMLELHNQYGKLVRIGPNEVSVADPEGVKLIYGAGTNFRKSTWYPVWNMAGDSHKFDLFADPTVEGHAANKRLVSNSYSANSLSELDGLVQGPINGLIQRMDEFAERGEPMNFSDWLQWFAFDVIGQVTFSHQFGFVEEGRDIDGTLKSIHEMMRAGIVIAEIPELTWMRKRFFFHMLPIIGKYSSKLNFLIVKANAAIAERRLANTNGERDLLSRFFHIQKENPERFDDLDIQILATLNIFAGSDTTSIALRAILYQLICHRRCWDKLVTELETASEAGQISERITFAEAKKLPYLQACIKEAMRLHPSLGHNQTRFVPEGGATIGGSYLPPQTIVGINAWVMHRQKSIFGEDADEYRPERWIEGNKPLMERHFMSFGVGAHVCLGKSIALLEINKTIPQIVQRFELYLAHAEDGGWSCVNLGFVIQENFHVICRRKISR